MGADFIHREPCAVGMLLDIAAGDGMECGCPLRVRRFDDRAEGQRHRSIAVHDAIDQREGLLERIRRGRSGIGHVGRREIVKTAADSGATIGAGGCGSGATGASGGFLAGVF